MFLNEIEAIKRDKFKYYQIFIITCSVLPEAEKYRFSCQNPEIAAGPNYGVSHNKHHVKSNVLAILRIVSLDAM